MVYSLKVYLPNWLFAFKICFDQQRKMSCHRNLTRWLDLDPVVILFGVVSSFVHLTFDHSKPAVSQWMCLVNKLCHLFCAKCTASAIPKFSCNYLATAALLPSTASSVRVFIFASIFVAVVWSNWTSLHSYSNLTSHRPILLRRTRRDKLWSHSELEHLHLHVSIAIQILLPQYHGKTITLNGVALRNTHVSSLPIVYLYLSIHIWCHTSFTSVTVWKSPL